MSELAKGVQGYTAPKVQGFLNWLVGTRPGGRHLEVGTYQGATFIAALQGNKEASGVAYDNFSEFDDDGEIEATLRENLEKFSPEMGQWCFKARDFFENVGVWKDEFDSFFYDGLHTAEAHYKAVSAAFEVCKPGFVYVVDDWEWEAVRTGTWVALKDHDIKRIQYWHLDKKDGYHEGLGVFLIEKGVE